MQKHDVKRIFIGIPAGGPIKSILPLIQSNIHCKFSLIKWIPLENIHLTLSFLGEIPNNHIPNLIISIGNRISMNEFMMSISGTGIFPSPNSPKVLLLGLNRGIDELKILNNQIEKSVKEFKNNYDKNTFIPHITIAKIKNGFRKIDVLPFLNTVYSPIDLEVNSISMYESKLLPAGAQYTIINTFPLN